MGSNITQGTFANGCFDILSEIISLSKPEILNFALKLISVTGVSSLDLPIQSK